jgi:hypothetical protein
MIKNALLSPRLPSREGGISRDLTTFSGCGIRQDNHMQLIHGLWLTASTCLRLAVRMQALCGQSHSVNERKQTTQHSQKNSERMIRWIDARRVVSSRNPPPNDGSMKLSHDGGRAWQEKTDKIFKQRPGRDKIERSGLADSSISSFIIGPAF